MTSVGGDAKSVKHAFAFAYANETCVPLHASNRAYKPAHCTDTWINHLYRTDIIGVAKAFVGRGD